MINRKYILKSSLLASTNLIQFIFSSLVLTLVANFLGQQNAALYGLSASIFLFLSILSTGNMIWQISELVPVISEYNNGGNRSEKSLLLRISKLDSNFRAYNYFISLFLLLLCFLIIVFGGVTKIVSAWYLLAVTPLLVSTCFASSLQAKLQVFNKENKILLGNLISSATGCLFSFIYLSSFSEYLGDYALGVLGIQQSIVGICYLFYLKLAVSNLPSTTRKKRIGKVKLSNLSKIFYGSLDGFIFSGIFSFAIFSTTNMSSEEGFILAWVVSIMRMVVIPSKQFGLVGGRMYLLGEVKKMKEILSSSLLSLLIIGAVTITLHGSILTSKIPENILLMMLFQILLEPLTGVLYGFIKIVGGPEKAVKGLISSYLLFAFPLIIAIYVLGLATAENIWTALFITRLIFAASTISSFRNIRRHQIA